MLALESKLAELEVAETRASELQRTIGVLKADNEQLRETIRRLEIGFRRHISERVSPDQLKLVFSQAQEPSTTVTDDPASELNRS